LDTKGEGEKKRGRKEGGEATTPYCLNAFFREEAGGHSVTHGGYYVGGGRRGRKGGGRKKVYGLQSNNGLPQFGEGLLIRGELSKRTGRGDEGGETAINLLILIFQGRAALSCRF